MKTMSTIPKSLGIVSSGVSFWFGWAAPICSWLIHLIAEWTGIQTHLHLTQLYWEGNKDNKIRQHSSTWYNSCHYSFSSIHSDTSAFSRDSVPSFHYWLSSSSILHCHPSRSSAGLTLPLTPKDSTIVFWSSWMIQIPDEKDDVSELMDWWNWSACCWVSSFPS